jgi:hypothetical protein
MRSPRFSVLFLLISATAVHAVDFPLPAGAKAVIQVFHSYSWDNTAGWVVLKNVKSVRETFDAEGRILSREVFHEGGVLIETTRYAYSDAGHQKTTLDEKNETVRYAVVEKTAGGARETIHRADGAIAAICDTEFDRDGSPLSSEYRDPEGGLVWRIVYSYDRKRDCTMVSYCNPDGSLAFLSTYSYEGADEAGNWSTRTEYVTYADVKRRPKDIVSRSVEYRE